MIVNNINKIRNLIKMHWNDANHDDEFYWIQIMTRSKDGTVEKGEHVLKTYVIKNLEYFDRKMDDIIAMCDETGARAYIHPGHKSMKQIGLMMLTDLAQMIRQDNFSNLPTLFDSACGQTAGEKIWIIDIDTPFVEQEYNDMKNYINALEPIGSDKVIDYVPTVHGYHILTHGFNIQKFTKDYPNIDVHKNNMTLLYVNTEKFTKI